MSYSLNEAAKVKYSERETAVFKLLPVDPKSISSQDLAKRYYKGQSVPFHGRTIMVSTVKALAKKIQINREPFKVLASQRRGPWPIDFRLVRR